jgi:Domain of unknown function (DUF4062)
MIVTFMLSYLLQGRTGSSGMRVILLGASVGAEGSTRLAGPRVAVPEGRFQTGAWCSPGRSVNEGVRADVVIRTPDQRLRVFVSSTVGEAGELAAERRAVGRAISTLRLTPVLFEMGARPHPPRELYQAYLAQSDVFIGLYWQRYGRVGPGMVMSGLEEELELAKAGRCRGCCMSRRRRPTASPA